MKKFLIIRFSSIGDIVLTTPVIRCLKKQFPDAQIHFLTKSAYASLLQSNPNIDAVHTLKNSLNETIRELKLEGFDFVIDLHRNLRSFWVKFFLGAPTRSFPKLNFEKWIRVNLKINSLPDLHIVDRYFIAVKILGVVNDGQGLDFFITPKDEIEASNLPFEKPNGYVAAVLGATHKTKRMPANLWVQVIEKLDLPVVLIGASTEMHVAEQIMNCLGDKVYNACNKYSIGQSASIIKNARVVITHDTGMMHIAAAFKKPIVSIWGSTIPEFGMSPYFGHTENGTQKVAHSKSFVQQVEGLSCRPCSKIGFDACPKGHFKCMNLQDTSAISKATNHLCK